MRTRSLLLILASVMFAQTGGQITGEVRDPSGALVPGANVTVTNAATQVARTTETNTAGLYSFPDLTPGIYNVKVVRPGFDVLVKANIELQVQQTARVDFTLTVGQATQTIEVAANAALLATENATVGTVIEEQRIMELPLNGRSYFSLVSLSPNVTTGFVPAAQAAGRLGGSRGSLTIAVTGGRSTWENYTLDGITNTDIDFNTYILQPSVDALQEFKVQSGIYPAEFGRELGQVNAATKPGTNDYHGALWEFLRNDRLDAVPYDFASATRSATNPPPVKAPYRQNQYGYELGGPVRIPKLFNGKNRLFFMSNFEEYNSRQTSPAIITTLPPAMRGGDFSSILSAGYVIYDPTSRNLGSSTVSAQQLASVVATQSAFPGNIIPGNRISPQSTLLLQKWDPLPNLPQTTSGLPFQNYQYGLKIPLDKDTLTTRIDFNQSSKSQWFGRYSWNDESTNLNTGQITDDGETLYTRASQWMLSNVWTISPTKVNDARFGYNSLFNNITQQLAGKENVNQELGMPVSPSDPNSYGVPNIGLSQNLASFGNPTSSPFQINDKFFQMVDNFSWVIGKHSLRFGGEYRYNEFPQVGNEFPRGQFLFDSQYTNKVTATGGGSGGYTGADFLLGDTYDAIIAVSLAKADFRSSEWATYIDDTWRIHPHLTFSLGLRWEVSQPLLDAAGLEPNVQLQQPLPNQADVPDPALQPVFVRTGSSGNFYDGINFRYAPYWQANGGVPVELPLQTVRDGRMGSRLINTNYHDFAPRIGIAWSPSNKYSVRAGYGIFYSMESKNSIFDLARGMGGRATTLAPATWYPSTFTYTNFINTANLPVTIPIGLTWGAAQHLPDSGTQQFVLNVQRTIGTSSTLEVGYSGSVSRHLAFLLDENQGILNAGLPVVKRLPYPEWGASGIQYVMAAASGSYSSLRTQWTTRLSSNLNALLGYTWSKALDDTSNIRGTVGSDFSPQNALCPTTCEHAPSDFNIPQRFVASVLYILPFGKGQALLNHGGVVNQIVGGWQISTITTLQSGGVVNTSSWDSGGTNFVSNATRLNCIPGVNPVLPNNGQNGWYNPAAFANPVAGTFGTCGRNTLRGPWLGNQDVSIVKYFSFGERRTLEFRTEMFNAPNHVLLTEGGQLGWGNGSSPNPSSTFGRITSTSNAMRQIQLALKLSF
jgi:hypothetical protein